MSAPLLVLFAASWASAVSTTAENPWFAPPSDPGLRPETEMTVDLSKTDQTMIGFGTAREEDIGLLRSIPELAKKGRVLVGASRKRIVKKLVGEKSAVGKNIGGNVAIAVWAAMNGASVVRVHDVKETVQALRVIERLSG